jgi:hypothetical protein
MTMSEIETLLVQDRVAGSFNDTELVGLPEPVRAYFRAAIAPGTPLALAAQIRMRGQIKLGRWLPFRATQVLAPHRGTIWSARIAGVISGSDRYAAGEGGMDWKLGGLIRVQHAEGPDVSRSSAERAAGEAIWLPTALLPRFGVQWSVEDDHTITAAFDVDGRRVKVEYHLDEHWRVRSLLFERWGDPCNNGTFGLYPFGGDMTNHETFGGLTVPSAGSVGWFYGSDRWGEGEFFRYRIVELEALQTRTPHF